MHEWHQFLKALENRVDPQALSTWIQQIKLIHFDAQNLYLEADDYFTLNWFEEHIRPIASGEFRNNNNKKIKIHLSVKEGSYTKSAKPQSPTFAEEPLFFPSVLDPHKTFEQFLLNPSNLVPVKLLQEMSLESCLFNPIYLSGPASSGKTHLLMATTHKLQAQGYKALYVHASHFAEQVVLAIRSGNMHKFRSLYREVDFLAVDDIHLLAKKTATQEEFFHTFNTLHMSGKQILLSSPLLPIDLKEIEPRLISRFEWGVNFSLTPLLAEHFSLYLDARLQELHFPLPDAAKQYVLNHCSSFSSLLFAVDALVLKAHLQSEEKLSSEKAILLFKEIFQEEERTKLSSEVIIDTVADFFGIKAKEILGKSQTKECALPRQIAMFFLREELQLPFKKIGEIFLRDHSTVMSSIKLIAERSKNKEDEIFDSCKELKTQFASFAKEKALV